MDTTLVSLKILILSAIPLCRKRQNAIMHLGFGYKIVFVTLVEGSVGGYAGCLQLMCINVV